MVDETRTHAGEQTGADELERNPRALADCKAKAAGGNMHCDRCELTWSMHAGVRPYCDPITFGKMRIAALDAALEIEAFQERQVAGGFIAAPSFEQMRKATYYRRLASLVLRVSENEQIVALLRGRA